MANILIIAEKSEVAKAIDSAIRKNNYKPNNTYRVVAASGHLMTLQTPEEYDIKYKQWNLADLPIAFPNWKQVPKEDTASTHGMIAKKLDAIKQGLAWCDEVIHAGDPDDEGQLIVDELLEFYGCKKPVKRLDVNDSTEQYIIKMMDQLKDNRTMYKIGKSAYARTVADAMFGFNFSRYYTVSYHSRTPLSIGRVQTPTLGLVVNRDMQIENHIQQSYYVLNVTGTDEKGVSFPMTFEFEKSNPALTDGKVLDKAALEKVAKDIDGKQFQASVAKKKLTDQPPLPFNLVELQSYCNKTFGYSPEEVHNLTQSLRANALITYNRSSCQYLHEFQHGEAPGVLKQILLNLGMGTAPVDPKIKSKCFNDKYLQGEPHHAIIPTKQAYDISKLSVQEQNVYKAICLYYMIQFMPARQKEQTTVTIITQDKDKISATAAKTTLDGYYKYLHNGKTDDDNSPIIAFPASDILVTVSDPVVEEKKTKPPARYNQASLIKDMTCIAKYVTDPRIKQLLIDKDADKQKENGSIGTPATRDKIVSTLIDRGYLVEEGSGKSKHLKSTELGRSFYNILPDSVRSLDITAEWWAITQNIKDGKAQEDALYNSVLDEINKFLASPPPLQPLSGLQTGGSSGQKVLGNCPHCGQPVVSGPNGAYCSGKCGMYIGMMFGKQLTDAEVTSLLKMKKTTLHGLVTKDKKKYNMTITPTGTEAFTFKTKDGTEKTGFRLTFEKESAATIGTCPHCGGEIKMSTNGAYCANKCGMQVGYVYGKKLTEGEVKNLLDNKTITLKGMKSKEGKSYDLIVKPLSIEPFSYKGKDGKEYNGFQYKFETSFPERKKK